MRCLLIVAALLLTLGPARAEERRLVVVELFTSQGCTSCPPADAFLGELAGRADVLALGLHVDYWDYIGWKDPFAQRAHTERQRSYAKALHQRFVYTPQMVVDGILQGVGSETATIDKLIDKARRRAQPGPTIALSGKNGKRVLHVGAGTASAAATVWLVLFDSKLETKIKAGENKGLRLANYNVVRQLIAVGRWTGRAVDFPIDFDAIDADGDSAAVLIQVEETGPIVAAARIERAR